MDEQLQPKSRYLFRLIVVEMATKTRVEARKLKVFLWEMVAV